MAIAVPDSLRQAIQALEREAMSAQSRSAIADKERKKAEDAVRAHEKKLGFKDKFLGGLFGDKEKLVEYERLKTIAKKANWVPAGNDFSSPSSIEAQIDSKIDAYLASTDPLYKNLQVPTKAAAALHGAAMAFLSVIDAALEAVRKAKSMEQNDMMSTSSYFSTASYYDNASAKDAVQRVSNASAAFQRAAAAYGKEVKPLAAESAKIGGIDDTFDYIIDLSGIDGSFDLTSMFTMNALDRVRSNLDSLHDKVENVDNRVQRNASKAKAQLQSYKNQIRAACR